jgi:transposase InsO family protein
MAQADEDDEPALWMAQASPVLQPVAGERGELSAPPSPPLLHLDEPRAHAFLGDGSGDDKLEGWYLDSGATHHMTGCTGHFADLDHGVQGSVKFGDASAVEIRGIGSVIFTTKSGEHKLLHGVYYIPALRNSIVSLGQLDEHGAKVQIAQGVLQIWDRGGRLLAKVKRGHNHLYILHLQVVRPICLAACRNDEAWLWHERFGHLHFDALRKLGCEGMARGMPRIDHVEQLCDTCIVTKLKRRPFPQQVAYRVREQLELIHGDLCGPVTPATPGGRRFFLLLVDDASRFMWTMLLPTKAAAADAIKHIQAAAEMECGHKLRVLRTDNGGEFTSAEFAAYCADEGIKRHFSAPYTPQQNGVVERQNQTVVATARALLKQRGMPVDFWGEAVMTAVFLLNRSPTKSLEGKTPYEAWHGRTPAVAHLRTFDCLVYVKELSHVGKLDDRSTPGVFIGYADRVKGYRILDPTTRRVRTARDVVFDEGHGWDWSKEATGGKGGSQGDFTVEFVQLGGAGGAAGSSASGTPAPAPSPGPPLAGGFGSPAPATPVASPAPGGQSTPAFVTPLADDADHVDAAHDDTPLRYRTVDNILGDQAVPGYVQRNMDAELHLTHTGEPCSFAEAEGDAACGAAMQQEMDSIEHNNTWELVDLPAGHRPITLKWIFKLKKNEAGEVVKYKARLVAGGFVQQEGMTTTTPSRRWHTLSPSACSSRSLHRRGGASTTWMSSRHSSTAT